MEIGVILSGKKGSIIGYSASIGFFQNDSSFLTYKSDNSTIWFSNLKACEINNIFIKRNDFFNETIDEIINNYGLMNVKKENNIDYNFILKSLYNIILVQLEFYENIKKNKHLENVNERISAKRLSVAKRNIIESATYVDAISLILFNKTIKNDLKQDAVFNSFLSPVVSKNRCNKKEIKINILDINTIVNIGNIECVDILKIKAFDSDLLKKNNEYNKKLLTNKDIVLYYVVIKSVPCVGIFKQLKNEKKLISIREFLFYISNGFSIGILCVFKKEKSGLKLPFSFDMVKFNQSDQLSVKDSKYQQYIYSLNYLKSIKNNNSILFGTVLNSDLLSFSLSKVMKIEENDFNVTYFNNDHIIVSYNKDDSVRLAKTLNGLDLEFDFSLL